MKRIVISCHEKWTKATSRKSFRSDMTHSVKEILFRSCDTKLALINVIKKYILTNENFVARLAMFLQSLNIPPQQNTQGRKINPYSPKRNSHFRRKHTVHHKIVEQNNR
jgi:hypothetical protein